MRPRQLASQVLILQIAIVVTAVLATALISGTLVSAQVTDEYEKRSLAIGHSVANMPDVIEAFVDPVPSRAIQPIAEAIRRAEDATFVVVANLDGIRYSHPNPDLIGQRVSTDPSPALEGQEWVGIQDGTLGRSVRAKVPIFDAGGRVIGIVSVGFLEDQVNATFLRWMPIVAANVALALALGIIGSVLLARRLKRQTFGMQPSEIVALLEQRESTLHGIREGVLVTDRDGKVTLVNDEAKRLLDLGPDVEGRTVREVVPSGRIREVLTGERTGADQMLLAGDRVLVANRMPAVVRGETVGAVVTLRDRTELEGILRELDGVRSLAHALRAQAHEFSNKLHTVAGLIELGRSDEAVRFIARTALVHQELVDLIHERIGDPALAALLLAKAAIANERGVEFRLAGETRLPADAADARDLVTVVGNLVDNAVEAAAAATTGGWVEVAVQAGPEGVGVRVRDSGPGVADADPDRIFEEGFTTKTGTSHQGLGLALARQVAQRRGGWLRVSNDGGAVFTALIPAGGAGAS